MSWSERVVGVGVLGVVDGEEEIRLSGLFSVDGISPVTLRGLAGDKAGSAFSDALLGLTVPLLDVADTVVE